MFRALDRCFTPEEITKYDKYEADYASYLRAKYFSEKDVYGGKLPKEFATIFL